MTATPNDAAPSTVKRTAAVERLMQDLEHVEQLPVAEQLEALSIAQATLSAVLNDEPLPERPIPGMGHEA